MNYRKSLFLTLGLIALVIISVVLLLKKKFIFEYESPYSVKIIQTWFLPDELREISGIFHMGENEIACVQDEDGIIYIYNLASEKITSEIKFGKRGDYEGIAIKDETAYVLKSNGKITEIRDFRSDKIQTKTHQIFNSKSINIEGLFLDKDNRLLMGVKEFKDLDEPESIVIYALNLTTLTLEKEPEIDISMDDKIFADIPSSHPSRYFYLSEIAQHPKTEEYYVLEAKTPKLLILNPDKTTKTLLYLDETSFPQPEGLTFDEEGLIFISNEEDKSEPQNIQLIEIVEKMQKEK
ncbi:MAG: SdiA-regulated domain-containing protein [Psychroflexus sp.]|nr:SdiA-regulated domain-containing protein [Psychroflexus sp.]MDN6310094.1 SdiA-regulated domain-containing protein [Psychroflexus sp.]